jgi:hypothetical protein
MFVSFVGTIEVPDDSDHGQVLEVIAEAIENHDEFEDKESLCLSEATLLEVKRLQHRPS